MLSMHPLPSAYVLTLSNIAGQGCSNRARQVVKVQHHCVVCWRHELSTTCPTHLLHNTLVNCLLVMSAGSLCRQHDILFLKNKRFAGLKFPDMSHPTTLDTKFHGVLPADAMDFLK